MRLKTVSMAAAALVLGAGVVACQRAKPQVAALPLEMGAAAPLGEAPPPGGLPPAPPARIAALSDYRGAYAYPDRAWGMSWAFGDSPPDYAFYDEGVTPWVWVADDDSECLAEPVPGGERYYYFEPGAYTPFYVQDPSYGYGFENGQLVAIYARGGRKIAPSADPAAAATAGQYLARGRLLRQAASSQPHQAVAAANWNARRGLISAEHASFARDAARDPAWTAYHDQHQAQDQSRFAAEATRRESWAAQTDSRLGQSGRAQREQRAAQSIAPGGAPGGTLMGRAPMSGAPLAARATQRSGEVLNRYAVATAPPAGYQGRGRPERAPRQAFNAAPPQRAFAPPQAERAQALRSQAQRSQTMARSAAEQGNDAAYQARAQARVVARAAADTQAHAAFAERHAAPPPPQAAPVFHAPAAPQPEARAAAPPVAHAAPPSPPHVAPQAVAPQHPAPQAQAAPPAQHGGGSDKHH